MTRTANASQQIYDAVLDLEGTGRRAHRETIGAVTGLKLSIVDDHLKRMAADGRLKRIERGVYAPVPPSREDRAVSTTLLADGSCRIEVGDDLFNLSLREAKHLAMLLGGIPLAFAATVGR